LRALEGKVREATVSVKHAQPVAAGGRGGRRQRALVFAVILAVLVPLAWWSATVILRVETANGTLVVEMNDAEAEARIKDGRLVLTGPDGKVRYTLSPGEREANIDAGAYKVRVEGADGLTLDTPEFTLKKGDKVVVRVTAAPKVRAKDAGPDRSAAEWVLSLGGSVVVGVGGQDREVKAAADLPPPPFRLKGVNLIGNQRVNDAGLARLKDCPSLTFLDLGGTGVGDEGLAHLKGCKDLRELWLWGTRVSDAGLAPLAGCQGLTHLGLWDTQVGDAGLGHLAACKGLTWLAVSRTRVTDAGLAHFGSCKGLTGLGLDGTGVTDAGLASFKGCEGLSTLWLSGTSVTDAGVSPFKGCTKLADLRLRNTKVTAPKVAELREALPGCKIEWDGGVIEPRAGLDPDRTAAGWVLSIGGTVCVDGQEGRIKAAADLPPKPFQLTLVNLEGNKQVSDAVLAHLKGCTNLKFLTLRKTRVTAERIEELKRALPKCKIESDAR
jgi:hypothetical protein